MIITVAGGLAANLAAVILVGAALASVHLNHGGAASALLFATLIIMVVGLLLIVPGIVIRRQYRPRPEKRPRVIDILSSWYGLLVIAVGGLFELFGVMILIGLAARVK